MATEQRADIAGLSTRWLEGEHASPILYVHGVPNAADMWRPFLARTGGLAPDLPGFGASAKPASFDYSIDGYAAWLEAFIDELGIERCALVAHDWGAAALGLAQRLPERVQRLALIDALPLLEGYAWHRTARLWRRPLIGELAMGFTLKAILRRTLDRDVRDQFPDAELDAIWDHFDHGTQRAILKLYRSAPERTLAEAGAGLDRCSCPALVVWGAADRYIEPAYAERYARALGGPTRVSMHAGAGHWPWLDDPSVIDEVAGFLAQ